MSAPSDSIPGAFCRFCNRPGFPARHRRENGNFLSVSACNMLQDGMKEQDVSVHGGRCYGLWPADDDPSPQEGQD